jgi:hypothetical protein
MGVSLSSDLRDSLPKMFNTIVSIFLYILASTTFILPFVLENWNPQSITLKILSMVFRFLSTCSTVILPALARSRFETDEVFVFFEFLLLNASLASITFIYRKFPLLIYTNLRQQFITVVWEYIPGPASIAILIATPAIFVLVETVFFNIITHESSLYLGYFDRFHRGLWLALEGLGAGVSFCFGRDLHGSAQDLQAPILQASPPPLYFVSALSSISFTAHQDHNLQDATFIGGRALGDEEKTL